MNNSSEFEKSSCKFWLGVCAGFVSGLIVGGAIVAVLDYLDEKDKSIKKLKKDSDENYYYSTE